MRTDQRMLYPIYFLHSLVVILHICNIVVIVIRKRLHNAGNWFIVSLSLSDLLLAVLLLNLCNGVPIFSQSYVNKCFRVNGYKKALTGFSYTVSIMSTLGISLDKYISVEYCLRYHTIVTQKRVQVSILSIWVSTALLTTLLSVISAASGNWLYFNIPHSFIQWILSITIVVSALYIRHIRNKHERSITLRRRYFGVEAEQLNILQRLEASVVGIVRLDITTAAIY